MYFLKQISLLFTICFVSAGKTLNSRSKRYASLTVQRVLSTPIQELFS
jgi:hypothetical protein